MLSEHVRIAQQERSRATQQKILQAVRDTLVERGFAGTTTTVIANRAGVSQGALFKHFGSKEELLCAAVPQLFGPLLVDYREPFLGLHDRGDLAHDAVQALWTVFQDDRLKACIELYVAARHDQALCKAMAPHVAMQREQIRELALDLFGGIAGERLDEMIRGSMALMHGVLMMQTVSGDEAPALRFLVGALRAALAESE